MPEGIRKTRSRQKSNPSPPAYISASPSVSPVFCLLRRWVVGVSARTESRCGRCIKEMDRSHKGACSRDLLHELVAGTLLTYKYKFYSVLSRMAFSVWLCYSLAILLLIVNSLAVPAEPDVLIFIVLRKHFVYTLVFLDFFQEQRLIKLNCFGSHVSCKAVLSSG